eukprot:TRINITY_DN16081_c0_g1_i1.p1 TRINITY_DN16081_c0_g1~~TRINITY_DN16081_c0_g1_i1.p1  ORF type:complete len:130 (-),score=17.69 TRINITY_DN16081_c0_g1_i1:422-811(-)
MSLVWTASMYVAAAGVALLLPLLSGVKMLESFSRYFLELEFNIGPINTSIPMYVLIFSAIAWSMGSQEVLTHTANDPGAYHTDAWLGRKWRKERNWWIVTFNLVVWFANWRLSNVLTRIRREAARPHKD